MEDIQFDRDPAKARANLRKHGVAFEEAQTVFADDLALLIDDPDHSSDEARFVLLGVSAAPRILVVVLAYRSARTGFASSRLARPPRWSGPAT